MLHGLGNRNSKETTINSYGVWREPGEETTDLYPGLVVHDGRVTGSITAGRSRLPLWALITDVVATGWEAAEYCYSPSEYDWDAEKMSGFLYDLLELRGEFGRLLLILADAERCERESGRHDRAWWKTKRHRQRVSDQLRRCLATLEDT